MQDYKAYLDETLSLKKEQRTCIKDDFRGKGISNPLYTPAIKG